METTPLQKSVFCDEDIMQMIRENKKTVYEILYKKYWNSLLNFAGVYNNDKSACQEIVQDLFVYLLTTGSKLKINSSISSYLFVAIRNKTFNHIRKTAVYKKHISIACHAGNGSNNNVEEEIDFRELQKEINLFLHKLPEKYKEVYVLHQEDHFTIKQVSAILNRPVNTVEKQLRRAKRLLRDHLIMLKVLQN